MSDKAEGGRNVVLTSYCPICRSELHWLPFEPVKFPGADYVAFCVFCRREFGVTIPKKIL